MSHQIHREKAIQRWGCNYTDTFWGQRGWRVSLWSNWLIAYILYSAMILGSLSICVKKWSPANALPANSVLSQQSVHTQIMYMYNYVGCWWYEHIWPAIYVVRIINPDYKSMNHLVLGTLNFGCIRQPDRKGQPIRLTQWLLPMPLGF